MADQPTSPEPGFNLQQSTTGDRNQVIGSMSGNAKAIANVETYIENQIHQSLPRQLSLHQLPNDIADFTGRQAELQGLINLYQAPDNPKAVVISAIAGMPGVGKSALAIHLAHQLSSQFPDAQLYVNLRGTDTQPLEPFDVLGQWLRAFGLDDTTIPTDLPGRIATYRSLLAQKRAIVLLDNASTEAKVRDLIPGSPTCAVLITSRRRLTALAGVEVLDLAILSEPEAIDLLQTLVGLNRVQAEPDAAVKIAHLCGGLPLALRIAGGTLKGKSHWSLATYAAKLAEEKQRLTQLQLSDLDIRSSFQLSYRELAPAEAQLFQFLGLLPRDFAPDAAAALIGQEPKAIALNLERLVEVQLLEAISEDRYQFHDLIRLFAKEQCDREQSPEGQRAAQQHLVQWYGKQANLWDDVLDPLRRRKLAEARLAEQDRNLENTELDQNVYVAGLDWFELERFNLLTIIEWADHLQDWKQVIGLAANLVSFFDTRSYWQDWVKTHHLALNAAHQSQDMRGEAIILTNLGNVYSDQGRWQEAIDFYQQSLQIKRDLGNRDGEAITLNSLGLVYFAQGRWQEATELYQQSLQISRELGNHYREITSLNNLGVAYHAQGQWLEAINLFQQSLQGSRDLGDRGNEAQTLINLGSVYSDQSRWQEAIDFYQQSLQIKRELRNRNGEAQILNNLGIVYREQGRWQEAIDFFQQSLQIKRELGDRQGEAQTLGNLGTIYCLQGQLSEAIDLLQQDLQISRELGDRHGEAQTLTCLGLVYRNQGQWSEAIDLFQQSIYGYRELGDLYGEAQTLNNLGLVYRDQERWSDAINLFHQSLQIKRELGDRHGEAQTLCNLGAVYHQQRQWSEAIDFYQQDLQISRELGDCHGEGQSLANLGLLYAKQNQPEKAIAHYQEALTKLHPDSPYTQQVTQQLAALSSPTSPHILLGCLIWLVVIAFIAFNLWRGHWLIALATVLLFVGFITFNRWRSRFRRRA